MAHPKFTSLVNTAVDTLAQKGQDNVFIEIIANDIKIKLEFMIEKGKVWILSHHDRTKVRLENLDEYLQNV